MLSEIKRKMHQMNSKYYQTKSAYLMPFSALMSRLGVTHSGPTATEHCSLFCLVSFMNSYFII
jgi:hypothetical protein